MPPASSPQGCMEQDRRSRSFREDPFSGTDPGHRQGRDQVGALGSPACPRESAVVSACWLAPPHLTALAPTPPWLLPWGGYNSETIRITQIPSSSRLQMQRKPARVCALRCSKDHVPTQAWAEGKCTVYGRRQASYPGS